MINDVSSEQEKLLGQLVDDFAEKMKAKLVEKSRQGWNGWQNCALEDLKQGLADNLAQEDYLDVANYALLLNKRAPISALSQS